MKLVLNLGCYVSLCEGLRAGTGSLFSIVNIDCGGLSAVVIKKIIIIKSNEKIQHCLSCLCRLSVTD